MSGQSRPNVESRSERVEFEIEPEGSFSNAILGLIRNFRGLLV